MPEGEKPPSGGRLREKIQETFTLMLGAGTWSVGQGERLIREWTARGQVSRQEGKRMLEQLRAQARKNREELGRIVTERVRGAASAMPVTREHVESLEKRIEELTRKIEAMEKAPKSPKSPKSPKG